MANKNDDRMRRRFYGGILIFAVAAGILLAAVPVIRARLIDRVYILKTAMNGEVHTGIMAMGENDIPYPEEFLRPDSEAAGSRSYAEPMRKRLTVVQSDVMSLTPPVKTDTKNVDEPEKYDDTPRFQQGEAEREAYEKVLAANEKLAAMIGGNDPDFSFKAWGAARRDGDVYWVRVIFQDASGAEIEYIWQTDVSSGQTTPLNYNARTGI